MQKKKAGTSRKKKTSLRAKKKNTEVNKDKFRHLKMKAREMFEGKEDGAKKIEFIDNPDEIKISAVILKLADPYIERFWGDDDRVHTIIFLTTTVWNLSYLSEEVQSELIDKLIHDTLPQECDAQDIAQMLSMLDDLKARKEKFFPNLRVYIIGHDLRMDKNNIHLNVSSVPLNDKQ